MSSVKSIARQAGVSIATVSRALNNAPDVSEETRSRVLTIANRYGYAPANARRSTTNIAFAYAQETTISHPFDGALLDGVMRGLAESRRSMVVLALDRDKLPDESFSQLFMRKGVRGVLLRTVAATRHIAEQIAAEGFPHVVISDRFDEPYINSIDCDSKPGSEQAVEYLASLGHRRIAFAMHTVPDRDHVDRFQGYRAGLEHQGLPYDEKLVFKLPYTMAGGSTAIKMITSMPDRPTAVYFADPLMGVGAIRQAHELGLQIPQDLSIVGFDDTDSRLSVYPALTAVCQEAPMLGYEGARWLTRKLAGVEEGPLKRTLPTFFEINQSTAAPPELSSISIHLPPRPENGNGGHTQETP